MDNRQIEYIYFDVDNNRVLSSFEELVGIYCIGIKPVYEHSYMHWPSGQCLRAMSSTPETEMTLRIRLRRLDHKIRRTINWVI